MFGCQPDGCVCSHNSKMCLVELSGYPTTLSHYREPARKEQVLITAGESLSSLLITYVNELNTKNPAQR